MASYTAAQTRGSGSLGEELPSTGIDFFITNSLNSQGNYPVGYLTLEGNATANQNLSTDAAMTGSFSNIVGGISEKSIVTSETKWSVSVFGSGGSFTFTPDSTVAANSYYIKGVGPFKLDIGTPGPPPPFTNPNCFQFNGNSDSVYVAGNTTALDLTGEISISTWVTIDADVFNTGSGQKDYHIVDKYLPIGNNAKGYVLYIRRSGSGGAANTVRLRATFGCDISNTTFDCTCIVNIHTGAFKLEPNTPYNIVATFNPNFNPAITAGQIKIYIDGGLAATKNIKNPGSYTPAVTERFIIGNASSGPGVKEYHGKIDEVSIWDTELQGSDVTSLYDWNVNGNLNNYSKVANLKAWYRMGENANFSNPGGTGNWTLKSATDPEDTSLELTSVGVAEGDKISPGLIGPP